MARILRNSPAAAPRWRAAAVACLVAAGAWWALDGPSRVAGGPGAPRSLHADGVPAIAVDPGPGIVLREAMAAPATIVALTRVERAPSGAIVAVLRINGGPPSRHPLGDALGPGVRLARVDRDSVGIEREGRAERLALPAGVEPLRRETAALAGATPLSINLPRPPTPDVAQVLDAAPEPGFVTPSPDRPHPARGAVDRLIAAEALRLSSP